MAAAIFYTESNRYADAQSHADRFRIPQHILSSMRKSIHDEVLVAAANLKLSEVCGFERNLMRVVFSEYYRNGGYGYAG